MKSNQLYNLKNKIHNKHSAIDKLVLCVIGFGGGCFQRQTQEILKHVTRPLEIIIVFEGPKGGIINTTDVPGNVRSCYKLRGPSLFGDKIWNNVYHGAINTAKAFQILLHEKPDLVLAVGTAQAIPFGIASKCIGIPTWFVDSVTRVQRPSRTGKIMHNGRISAKTFYVWPSLAKYYRYGQPAGPKEDLIKSSFGQTNRKPVSKVNQKKYSLFVTVGTHHFDELVQTIDNAVHYGNLPKNILIQIGRGKYIPKYCDYFRVTSSMIPYYDQSELVVAHGGTGTTLEVISRGLPLISVANPMMQDNHQHEFLEMIESFGLTHYCRDLKYLVRIIQDKEYTQSLGEFKPHILYSNIIELINENSLT
jgi:beta-1,4-N-acetylglucosaminyltransferase